MVIRSRYFPILAEKSLGDIGGVPCSDSFCSAHPTGDYVCVCVFVRHHFEDDHYFCS